LYQDFGQTRPEGEPPVDWVEGVTILVAVFIVVSVGSLNDWQKEKQFKVLNEKRDERMIKVIRDGEEQMTDIHNVVVGDVVLFEPGEIIPCDGVFLSGHHVRCDESGATGESDTIKKLPYRECIAVREKRLEEFDPDGAVDDGDSTSGSRRNLIVSGLDLLGHTDCFMVSGSKVIEGIGSYLVITVGEKSFNGRIMMGASFVSPCIMFCSLTREWLEALRRDTENTPLQQKLNRLAEIIAKIGSIAGALLFFGLMIRFFVQLGTHNPQR
jgi:Ca2+-transporting ATPase